MKSLLLTPAESAQEADCSFEKPKYPYGTCLYLDKETLEKLGITELPDTGTTMTLMATVKVTGNSERETTDGVSKSLDLQITDMELGSPQATKTDTERANTLYGDAS